jgi:hypothetical protein
VTVPFPIESFPLPRSRTCNRGIGEDKRRGGGVGGGCNCREDLYRLVGDNTPAPAPPIPRELGRLEGVGRHCSMPLLLAMLACRARSCSCCLSHAAHSVLIDYIRSLVLPLPCCTQCINRLHPLAVLALLCILVLYSPAVLAAGTKEGGSLVLLTPGTTLK